MIEQRKNQRFDLHLPFEILGEKSYRPKGETMNVSSCGVLFTTPATVEVGDRIEYLITLPRASGARTDVRLRCMGKVVRSDEAVRSDDAVHSEEASRSEQGVRSEEPALAFAATLERYEFVRGKV
jgi:hypothetical protein